METYLRKTKTCSGFSVIVRSLFILFVGLGLAACGGGGGSPPPAVAGTNPSVAAKTSAIPAGDPTCVYGGVLVETGIDENSNGVLDANEVDASEKVCNGAPGAAGSNGTNGSSGLNALVNISTETAGANCSNGGKRIDSGLDANVNGSLDASEIASTDYVCDGAPGTNGTNGLNALIDMNPEPVGVNCPNGGLRIDVGIDTNGNGSLDSAEITQTGFVCSGTNGSVGWQVAGIIDNGNGDAQYPQVVADKFGNVVAVWVQNNAVTGRDEIWSNRFVPGMGWSAAERINTGSYSARNPQVSVDGVGNVIAVWRQLEGGSSLRSIWANRFVGGVGWGTAELIDASGVGFGGLPQVAMDASGNAIAVWQQQDSSYLNSIWSNRYVVNVGWGTAELIETDDAGAAVAPQVGVDASGNAIAVWSQADASGRYSIWSNRYLSGTGWVTAELIETVDTGDTYTPLVSVDASGNAIVTWSQYDGATYNVWANRLVAGVGWGTAELIGAGGWRPQVAMDGSGNAIAVWRKSSRVWSSRYVVGSGWGTPERIIDKSSGTVMAPQVSVDTSGNAMTVWYQSDGVRNNIWATRYVVGLGWGVAQLIETNNIGDAWFHGMTMDAEGNVIVVWQQSDGFRDNIWSNRWQAP